MAAPLWMHEVMEACAHRGVDLARPFGLAAFHATCPPDLRLDDFGRSDALALVLGNTRALWGPFLDALAADPELLEAPHPLDRYVEDVVLSALASVPVPYRVFWGHHRQQPVVALQRIAAAAGLAELGPAHLSVHPEHGPWIGLRAVVVFDVDARDQGERDEAPGSVQPSHCATCQGQPCVPALARALTISHQASGADAPRGGPLPPHLPPEQQAWLALRDACPIGRSARYEPLQVHYHYTKSPRALRMALEGRSADDGGS